MGHVEIKVEALHDPGRERRLRLVASGAALDTGAAKGLPPRGKAGYGVLRGGRSGL